MQRQSTLLCGAANERLRADQHADVEQDRCDRDDRDQRHRDRDDAERDGGHQYDAEKFEAGEHVTECRHGHGETEIRNRAGELVQDHAAIISGH